MFINFFFLYQMLVELCLYPLKFNYYFLIIFKFFDLFHFLFNQIHELFFLITIFFIHINLCHLSFLISFILIIIKDLSFHFIIKHFFIQFYRLILLIFNFLFNIFKNLFKIILNHLII